MISPEAGRVRVVGRFATPAGRAAASSKKEHSMTAKPIAGFSDNDLIAELSRRLGRADTYEVMEWQSELLETLQGYLTDDTLIDLHERSRKYVGEWLDGYDGAPMDCYDYVSTTATDLAATGVMPR